MRSLLLCLVIVWNAPSIVAQCVTSNMGLDPLQRNTQVSDIRFVQGGLVVAGKPLLPDYTTARGINVSRTDAVGHPVWFRHLLPTNPSFHMSPPQISSTLDDGVLLAGDLNHTTHITQYLIKLAANGAVDWARIYMMPDSAVGVLNYVANIANRSQRTNALTDGGYAWQITNERDVYHVVLDADGVPVSARAYQDPGLRFELGVSALRADGSWFHGYAGDSVQWTNQRMGYFGVDPSGSVQFAHRMTAWNVLNYVTDVLDLANGDRLMSGNNGSGYLHRVDPSGQILWRRTSWWPQRAAELSDGTFIAVHGSMLLQFTSDGYSLDSWWGPNWGCLTLAASGDSTAAVGEPSGPLGTQVLLTDGAPQFGGACGLSSQGPIIVNTEPTSPYPITIDVDTAYIKTWTMSLNGTLNDTLDLVAFAQMGNMRPGFPSYVTGSAINLSGSTSAGFTVSCVLPGLLAVQSVEPTPTSVVGNTYTWQVPDGLGQQSYWSFRIDCSLPPDPGLIGTILGVPVLVVHDSAEVDVSNNSYTVTRMITGSYDPNDKLVRTSSGLSDTEYYPADDTWLDYTIRFQNTGNDTAFTVVLVDSLPSVSAVSSFTVLGASHPYTYTLGGEGILRVTFSNILLPDSGTNMAASQGFFAFRIAPEQTPVIGTSISNAADIYFDFNPPVRTPPATVVVAIPMAATTFAAVSQEALVFPNPARDHIEVLLPNGFKASGWSIWGPDGRIVQQESATLRGRTQLVLQDLSSGVYVIGLWAPDGSHRSVRFVVE